MIGHTDRYFAERDISLDQRGILEIDPESYWGFHITVLTLSHDLDTPERPKIARSVIVEKYAWICSNVVLYNCIIREGAIVALGSVVRSCEVKPWTMVAGNPARVIAHCPNKALDQPWEYIEDKWRVLE